MTTQSSRTLRCGVCFSSLNERSECDQCGPQTSERRRDRRSLPLGHVVGEKYRVGRVLGVGGFGITYVALDTRLNRRVALKEYFPSGLVARLADDARVEVMSDSQADVEAFDRGLRRFFTEGMLLATFDHPNIVRVHDVLEANGTAYLAMEYHPGETLQDLLARTPQLSLKEVVGIMDFVLDALAEVHRKDTVHRDLKPDNIYLTQPNQRVLLLDFGGAKQLTATGERSTDAMFAHGYAAPEQYVADSNKVGPWTDVYGFGATLFRMFTGHRLASALERSSAPADLDWRGAQVPPAYRALMEKSVSLLPRHRYPSIAALIEDWEGAQGKSEAPRAGTAVEEDRARSPPPVEPTVVLRPWGGLTGSSKLAVAAFGVVAIGLGAWYALSGRPAGQAGASPSAIVAGSTTSLSVRDRLLAGASTQDWPAVERELGLWSKGTASARERSPRFSATELALHKKIELQMYGEAVEELERIFRAQPDNAGVSYLLGYALLRQRDRDGAWSALSRSIEQAPEFGSSWAALAEVLAARGDAQQAKDATRLAVYLAKDRAALQAHLTANAAVEPMVRAFVAAEVGALTQLPVRQP